MKSVRDMTDAEFKAFTRFDRATVCAIMMAQRYSVIPDRPMHPNAKMSGGDKPLASITRWLIDLHISSGAGAITSLNRNTVSGEIKPIIK